MVELLEPGTEVETCYMAGRDTGEGGRQEQLVPMAFAARGEDIYTVEHQAPWYKHHIGLFR